MKNTKSLKLTETAVMISLAFVLSMLKVIDMPFGGSVTAFSMLPIALIAYRYRTLWGLFAGLTFSLLQLVMGLKNLTYATSAVAAATIICLDYIVAFTVLGLAGVLRDKVKDQGTAFSAGALIACVLRFICHVIAGCTVWAGVSIPTSDGLIYSLAYNGAYMIPETLLTVVAAYYVGKAFNITEENIKRVPLEKGALVNLYAAAPVVVGTLFSFVFIFALFQTEDKLFDITAIANADFYKWLPILAIFAVGILASIIIKASAKNEKS